MKRQDASHARARHVLSDASAERSPAGRFPVAVCLLVLAAATPVFAESPAPAEAPRPALEPAPWPRWRGSNDDGTAPPGPAPLTWDATTNVRWKAPLPGPGCSTPIVWSRRIVLTASADGKDAVLAFDPGGRSLWRTTLGPERKGKHRNGSGSNPSPATDGRRVFVYFKSGALAALDGEGRVLWATNVQERFGPDTLYWDIGTSPVLTGKDVVVSMIRRGESWLAAFAQEDGALRWRAAQRFVTPDEGDHSYATPLVVREGGREVLLVLGGERLTAHDAADGSVLWWCGGFNPAAKPNWVPVASPVLAGGLAIVPYGRGGTLHGIRPEGTGDVTGTHRAWVREDTGSFVPTPAVAGGKVYLLRDRGGVQCIDPATGATVWGGELPKGSASYYASPLAADGKVYCAREDGVVFVTRAEGPLEVLAENRLVERLIASPVPLAPGRLLLRGEKHLWCVGAE
jgi:outer membrane protein assembly factor BamB